MPAPRGGANGLAVAQEVDAGALSDDEDPLALVWEPGVARTPGHPGGLETGVVELGVDDVPVTQEPRDVLHDHQIGVRGADHGHARMEQAAALPVQPGSVPCDGQVLAREAERDNRSLEVQQLRVSHVFEHVHPRVVGLQDLLGGAVVFAVGAHVGGRQDSLQRELEAAIAATQGQNRVPAGCQPVHQPSAFAAR
jgi:hypothetical protein